MLPILHLPYITRTIVSKTCVLVELLMIIHTFTPNY